MNSSARSFRVLLLGATVFTGLLVQDLLYELSLLDLASRAALLAGGLVLWAAMLRVHWPSRWKVPVVVAFLVVLVALGTGLAGDWKARSARSTWEERSHEQLLLEAERVGEEFRELVDRLAAPSEIVATSPQSPIHSDQPQPTVELFEEVVRLRRQAGIDSPRFGLTLVDGGGEPLAWSGDTSILDRGLFTALYLHPTAVLVSDSAVATRLYHLSRVSESGNALIAEYLVSSSVQSTSLDELLPSLQNKRERWNLRFLDFRKSETYLEELFRRHEDRYWGGYSGARNTLIFPLRSPRGAILGMATLRAAEESPYLGLLRRQVRGVVAGLMALALGVMLTTGLAGWLRSDAAGDLGRAAGSLMASSGLLWLIRIMLSRGGFPHEIWDLPPFDFSTFASRRMFDLINSPADLLLTGGATLLQSLVIALFLRQLAREWAKREPPRAFGAASVVAVATLVGLGVVMGNGFGRAVRHVVSHTRIDLLSIQLTRPGTDRVLILAAFMLFLLALLWILAAITALMASRLGWPALRPVSSAGLPGGLSFRMSLLPGVALATVVLYPILVHAQATALTSFFENNLKPQVRDHRALREAALRRSMEAVAGDSRLGEALALGTVQDGTGAAFDTWLRTALADEGFDSSVTILEAGGVPIGRFSLNMPFLPALDQGGPYLPEMPRKEFFQGQYGQEEVLRATVEIRHRRMTVGLAVLQVLDRYQNLPFLTSIDPYTRIFRSVRRRAPDEESTAEPVLFVYSHTGKAMPSGADSPPALPHR